MLESLLKGHKQLRLDVVSLAEARETVANAATSASFDERLQSQMKLVLDFVQEQLKHVPHARREQMTLGEFLSRHTYLSGGTSLASESGTERFLADVLQRKLKQVIGDSVEAGAADFVDWELANVRTNPGTHKKEDARVREAMKEGKGYNLEGTVEAQLDNQLNGRASQELGEEPLLGVVNPETGIVEVKEKWQYDMELVLRDAKKLTELRPEGHYMKNYYEN